MQISVLREQIQQRLGTFRAAHVLSTEEEAVRIAALYLPEQTEKVRISALLHDITKEYDVKQHLQIFDDFGISVDGTMMESPKVFHAKTAALLLPKEFPDYAFPEIISAVEKHTTGSVDMSMLDIIIYLADYIEPTRRFEDCKMLRSYFWDGLTTIDTEQEKKLHLYKTMVLSFDLTIQNLIREQTIIAPETIAARNAFVMKCKGMEEGNKR